MKVKEQNEARRFESRAHASLNLFSSKVYVFFFLFFPPLFILFSTGVIIRGVFSKQVRYYIGAGGDGINIIF